MSLSIISSIHYVNPRYIEKYLLRFLKKAEIKEKTEIAYICLNNKYLVPNKKNFYKSNDFLLDFSGYIKGINLIKNDNEMFLIFNDTLFTKYDYLFHAKKIKDLYLYLKNSQTPIAAGRIAKSTDILSNDPYNLAGKHLSTHCILMNKFSFQIFKLILKDFPIDNSLKESEEWIKEKLDKYPKLSIMVDLHLSEYKNPWQWKNQKIISKKNYELKVRKKITVIFEYLFTIKMIEEGCILPTNFTFKDRLNDFIYQKFYSLVRKKFHEK